MSPGHEVPVHRQAHPAKGGQLASQAARVEGTACIKPGLLQAVKHPAGAAAGTADRLAAPMTRLTVAHVGHIAPVAHTRDKHLDVSHASPPPCRVRPEPPLACTRVHAATGRAHPLLLMYRVTYHSFDPPPTGHKKSQPGKEWLTFYKCGKPRRLMVGRTMIYSYNLLPVPLPPRPW